MNRFAIPIFVCAVALIGCPGTTGTTRTSSVARTFFGVAVGEKGSILTAANEPKWTKQDSKGTETTLNAVIHSGSLWVAVGDVGTILTSTDGILWVSRTQGDVDGDSDTPEKNWTEGNLRSIAYGDSLWVAVGDRIRIKGDRRGTILTSSNDGETWSVQKSKVDRNLYAVAHNGGSGSDSLWMAVGGAIESNKELLNCIITSTDGKTWTNRSIEFKFPVYAVAHNGGSGSDSLWVVVGHNGTILTSNDNGENWKARSSGARPHLKAVARNDSLWVAVGENGTIRISNDNGETWIKKNSTPRRDVGLNAVTHDGSRWVAVGDGSIILTSSDGTVWKVQRGVRPPRFSEILYGIARTNTN